MKTLAMMLFSGEIYIEAEGLAGGIEPVDKH